MITIKLFAAMAEEAGLENIQIPYQKGLTTEDVKQWLIDAYPILAARVPAAMVAVNQTFVPTEHILIDEDEVAFIPPVSGG
ncbi:molybdopterin synthase subunit MoaD [Aneurinibacillus soli]|uniref:Molybdopterin synthase sulfur carrier subunit n=1 Tax=Aneurinibacillus soli TaxID=1500254 RepID=A0A0U5B9U7_9BACL|nr:molybdopterin converting factor subunit 1 [Aneurinibacillus soli]PYE61768.1 molybdopterin synthase subunit MoaD [Aneurinibacillus soli]BAU28374.1 Molybdopterin synthase sulfur carrier subunit [Aneurinibacillus soli]